MLYDGMECNPDRIQSDPELALNDPGMKLCVNVMTAARPNYLYICLDSLFRNTVFCHGTESPDVFIYVDILPNGVSYSGEILKVASHFPVQGIFINKEHKGVTRNYWESFSKAFNDGYDFCLQLEEDWLITTDALRWLYDVPKVAQHYSLYRWTDKIKADGVYVYSQYCRDMDSYSVCKDGRYISWCSAYPKGSFELIHDIVKAKGYLGLYDLSIGELDRNRIIYADWDRIIVPIMMKYGFLSQMPSTSLLAHFGSQTCQQWGYGDKGNYHSRIFTDDQKQWLDNVIEVFKTTTDAEKESISFRPLDFEYR